MSMWSAGRACSGLPVKATNTPFKDYITLDEVLNYEIFESAKSFVQAPKQREVTSYNKKVLLQLFFNIPEL